MSLTRDEVRHIALLARLRLTADEEARLGHELGQILQHVTALERLNTSGIEPMAHALEVVNVVRKDGISNRPDREALLANAPATEAGFFAVPKIIE
jgi:aspartyl-tRNA(Asn)/glutamyl-tRNA(Gln) amidotransferase subunit C